MAENLQKRNQSLYSIGAAEQIRNILDVAKTPEERERLLKRVRSTVAYDGFKEPHLHFFLAPEKTYQNQDHKDIEEYFESWLDAFENVCAQGRDGQDLMGFELIRRYREMKNILEHRGIGS